MFQNSYQNGTYFDLLDAKRTPRPTQSPQTNLNRSFAPPTSPQTIKPSIRTSKVPTHTIKHSSWSSSRRHRSCRFRASRKKISIWFSNIWSFRYFSIQACRGASSSSSQTSPRYAPRHADQAQSDPLTQRLQNRNEALFHKNPSFGMEVELLEQPLHRPLQLHVRLQGADLPLPRRHQPDRAFQTETHVHGRRGTAVGRGRVPRSETGELVSKFTII